MIGLLNEHERTMAFAEVALGQIKSLRQTAVPRNYEIWYVYATGYNPALNKIINETLARAGKLTETDLEQLYDTYLSQLRASERIDKVGSRVVGEIDDVMTLINEALGSTATYGTRSRSGRPSQPPGGTRSATNGRSFARRRRGRPT